VRATQKTVATHTLVNTQKSTNNPIASFGLIEENIELFHIHLAVQDSHSKIINQFHGHALRVLMILVPILGMHKQPCPVTIAASVNSMQVYGDNGIMLTHNHLRPPSQIHQLDGLATLSPLGEYTLLKVAQSQKVFHFGSNLQKKTVPNHDFD
jgi:hypothetical protein